MLLIVKGQIVKAICCACRRPKPTNVDPAGGSFLCDDCGATADANLQRMMDAFPESRDRRLVRYRQQAI